MRRSVASSTAETMAMHRAAESMLPENERVCSDPYALYFLNSRAIPRFRSPFRRAIVRWVMNHVYPGVNGAVVARVRFIDDCLERCIDSGLEQLVILGAGYDTRAYRFEALKEKVRVFEVDHPATQAVKRDKLKSIFPGQPGHVTFVPVDIGTQDLEAELSAAGYDPTRKTLFILEGTIMYISPEMVDNILSFIVHRSGPGSSLVFDCLPASMIDGTIRLKEGKAMRKHVIRQKEPFLFGVEENRISSFLEERGFNAVERVSAPDCRDRYFKGKNRDRKISAVFSFVHAAVGNP